MVEIWFTCPLVSVHVRPKQLVKTVFRIKSPFKIKSTVQIHCFKGTHIGYENRRFTPKNNYEYLKRHDKIRRGLT